MPSTYSPDLRIELIANGEQSGTWGTTTNSNLGTVIEDAISALASVSVTSANQALTALNGTADQARCSAVSLTTTTAANFAVYVPPVTKLYVITNPSGYTATVYCSTVLGNTTAAGTGVAIPTGKSVLLRADGTNIVEQLNHVVGAFSVGGALSVTSTSTFTGSAAFSGVPTAPTASVGTNTTQLATTAFVEAAKQAIYPVGSIYINATNATNPATLLGFGTWTAFGAGRVPVGFDSTNVLFDTAEETGGSANAIVVSHTHTATVTDPGHNHVINTTVNLAGGSNGPNVFGNGSPTQTVTNTTGITVSNSTEGSSGTNANYQPYITVYMWKRTV